MSVQSYQVKGKKRWKVVYAGLTKKKAEELDRLLKVGAMQDSIVDALLAKLKPELPTPPPVSTITFREAWEAYEPTSKRTNRSWKADRARAKNLIRHIGSARITSMTPDTVEVYREQRLKEVTYRGTAPTPCTLNHEVRLWRHVINHILARGDIEKNPIARVKLLRENNVRSSVITEEQLESLIGAADEDLKPIILVAYDTGMRKSEILRLRWANIDMQDGIMVVTETKNDQPRAVYLTGRAKAELQKLPRSISGYVFVNPRTNKPWVDIKKKWNKVRKAVNLKHVWFHDHRRSFVTNARRAGVSESVVMRLSGHKTRVVFERYNIVDESDKREAIRRIEAALELDAAQKYAAVE